MAANAGGRAEHGSMGLADSDGDTGTDGRAKAPGGPAQHSRCLPGWQDHHPAPGTIEPPTRLPRNRSARYARFT
jgi:hypothetical protein